MYFMMLRQKPPNQDALGFFCTSTIPASFYFYNLLYLAAVSPSGQNSTTFPGFKINLSSKANLMAL